MSESTRNLQQTPVFARIGQKIVIFNPKDAKVIHLESTINSHGNFVIMVGYMGKTT